MRVPNNAQVVDARGKWVIPGLIGRRRWPGTMLSWMQDRGADGLIFIGPPGAAKSAIGKTAGATAGIPKA